MATNELHHDSPDIMDVTPKIMSGNLPDSESKAIWLALRQIQDRLTKIEHLLDVLTSIGIKDGHILVEGIIKMQQLRNEMRFPNTTTDEIITDRIP